MVTEITQGIKVTVETEYQPAYSSPTQYHFVFTYRITIENQSENTIQLMRRHWHIYDAGAPLTLSPLNSRHGSQNRLYLEIAAVGRI